MAGFCFCWIPVKGVKVAPVMSGSRNMEKREFCKKFDGYNEFCDGKYMCVILLLYVQYVIYVLYTTVMLKWATIDLLGTVL